MQRRINLAVLLLVFPFFISAQSTAKDWYSKGIDLKKKENYTDAITAFKNAIARKSDYSDAYYQAGWCSNALENYWGAIALLEKYNPSSNRDKKNKYNELGYSYYKLERSKESIEYFLKTLALFPADGLALRGIGTAYFEIDEDHDKALEYYEKAVAVDEAESKPVYYKLGWLYNDKERYDDAIKILLKAIDYDSEDSGYREELGFAYYMKGQHEFAITQLNKAISLEPTSKLGYFYKGLCYIATDKKGDAMSMYYKLKELDSDEAGELLEKINKMKP